MDAKKYLEASVEQLKENKDRKPAPRRKNVGKASAQLAKSRRNGSPSTAPLVAAYQAGRLLNQLNWHLQQAWLLPAVDMQQALHHADSARGLFTDLPGLLNLALPVEAHVRIHDAIQAARTNWDRDFNSLGHRSTVENAVEFIRHELSQDGDIDPARLRFGEWARMLPPYDHVATDLFDVVLVELEDHCKLAFNLGLWVDRAIHPRDVAWLMCWAPKTEEPQAPLPADPWSLAAPDRGAAIQAAQRPEPPIVLFPLVAGTVPPEESWYEELRRMLRELKLEQDNIKLDAGKRPTKQTSTWVDRLDKGIRGCLARRLTKRTHAQQDTIPASFRTRPMTLKRAATYIYGSASKDAVKRLRSAIEHGTIHCETQTRQQHVFSKMHFPKELWKDIA